MGTLSQQIPRMKGTEMIVQRQPGGNVSEILHAEDILFTSHNGTDKPGNVIGELEHVTPQRKTVMDEDDEDIL